MNLRRLQTLADEIAKLRADLDKEKQESKRLHRLSEGFRQDYARANRKIEALHSDLDEAVRLLGNARQSLPRPSHDGSEYAQTVNDIDTFLAKRKASK